MSERIEKLIKEYPMMVRERNLLANEIANFQGVTAEEVIESMYCVRLNDTGIQTKSLSDKTGQIALNYKAKTERINREWFEQLENRLNVLTDELVFFDAALMSLSGNLPSLMRDLVVEQMTWDELEEKYHVCRTMIGKYRRKGIRELEVLYEKHEQLAIAFMLG